MKKQGFIETTEFLTDKGWLNLQDYLAQDVKEVAYYDIDTKEIKYCKPISVFQEHVDDNIHHWTGTKFDISIASESRVLRHKQEATTPAFLDFSKNVKTKNFSFITSANNYNTEYDITDDELRLLAWIHTDGGSRYSTWMIYQSKIENVDIIEDLLIRLNLRFTKNFRNRNTTQICGKVLKKKPLTSYEFYINAKQPLKITKKAVLEDWYNLLSRRQFDIFLDTLILGDGSRHISSPENSMMLYGTKDFIDQLQILCIKNGYAASIYTYRQTQYKLNIHKDKQTVRVNSSRKQMTNFYEVPYKGVVWGVETINNTLIIRNNDKVSIQAF